VRKIIIFNVEIFSKQTSKCKLPRKIWRGVIYVRGSHVYIYIYIYIIIEARPRSSVLIGICSLQKRKNTRTYRKQLYIDNDDVPAISYVLSVYFRNRSTYSQIDP